MKQVVLFLITLALFYNADTESAAKQRGAGETIASSQEEKKGSAAIHICATEDEKILAEKILALPDSIQEEIFNMNAKDIPKILASLLGFSPLIIRTSTTEMSPPALFGNNVIIRSTTNLEISSLSKTQGNRSTIFDLRSVRLPGGTLHAPVCSSDGKIIAQILNNPQELDIVSNVRYSFSNIVREAPEAQQFSDLTLSADGSVMAFVLNGNIKLRKITIKENNELEITEIVVGTTHRAERERGFRGSHPKLNRDGSVLAYLPPASEHDIVVVKAGEDKPYQTLSRIFTDNMVIAHVLSDDGNTHVIWNGSTIDVYEQGATGAYKKICSVPAWSSRRGVASISINGDNSIFVASGPKYNADGTTSGLSTQIYARHGNSYVLLQKLSGCANAVINKEGVMIVAKAANPYRLVGLLPYYEVFDLTVMHFKLLLGIYEQLSATKPGGKIELNFDQNAIFYTLPEDLRRSLVHELLNAYKVGLMTQRAQFVHTLSAIIRRYGEKNILNFDQDSLAGKNLHEKINNFFKKITRITQARLNEEEVKAAVKTALEEAEKEVSVEALSTLNSINATAWLKMLNELNNACKDTPVTSVVDKDKTALPATQRPNMAHRIEAVINHYDKNKITHFAGYSSHKAVHNALILFFDKVKGTISKMASDEEQMKTTLNALIAQLQRDVQFEEFSKINPTAAGYLRSLLADMNIVLDAPESYSAASCTVQ